MGIHVKVIARCFLTSLFLLGTVSPGYCDSYTLANDNSGNGYVVGSYPEFQLWGANSSDGPNNTTYTTTITAPETLRFAWTYTTHGSIDSFWEPAGFIVDGFNTQLSPNGMSTGQSVSGFTEVSLNAGDTFGWYVLSLNSSESFGELDVEVTPEPGSLLLFGTGLLCLALAVRRKLAV